MSFYSENETSIVLDFDWVQLYETVVEAVWSKKDVLMKHK